VGDGIAQATSHLSARRVARPGARKPRFQYDWARAARLCAYAACLGTPIGHYWFAFLDKVRSQQGGFARLTLGPWSLGWKPRSCDASS
jgi:hypothetical protein